MKTTTLKRLPPTATSAAATASTVCGGWWLLVVWSAEVGWGPSFECGGLGRAKTTQICNLQPSDEDDHTETAATSAASTAVGATATASTVCGGWWLFVVWSVEAGWWQSFECGGCSGPDVSLNKNIGKLIKCF
jgi:hypothetical protein